MRVIILAAGQGYQLDGFNKLLIKHPKDGKRIIDKYIDAFKGKDITVVVGYRGINVMHEYAQLDYVYNRDWGMTNNSYSLSLAIDEKPCYVLSGDLLFEPELINFLDDAPPNCLVSKIRESRTLSAINIIKDDANRVKEVYQGILRDVNDPEAVGIIKISSSDILKQWRKNCIAYPNLFVAQNINFFQFNIQSVDTAGHSIEEVNTPEDYIRLMKWQIN